MASRSIVLESKRATKKNGVMVYHDTIERKPNEVIHVFDPHEVKQKTKHIKLQNSGVQKEQMMNLSRDEKLLIFCLAYYLDWETNIVVGDDVVGQKGHPLKASDLDTITGLDRHRRAKAVKGLIEKNILAYITTEERRKAYVMNPDWALNGRNPQESLINTFNSKIDVENEQKVVENEPLLDQELVRN